MNQVILNEKDALSWLTEHRIIMGLIKEDVGMISVVGLVVIKSFKEAFYETSHQCLRT